MMGIQWERRRDSGSEIWTRVRRIMVFGESHATRFTVAFAEVLMCLSFAFDQSSLQFQSLKKLNLGPDWVWIVVMMLTTITQIRGLLIGRYHGKGAVLFSAWDSLWWIFMTAAVYAGTRSLPEAQVALATAASWVFISSGFTAYGKRGTDYGITNRRIRD